MAQLELLNPVAQTVREVIQPASRLSRLEGKRLGLYWNIKAGGDVALARVGEQLSARYGGLTTHDYVGSVGFIMRHMTPEDADRIAQACDAVVGTSSD
jgi:hypothetical protein